jgi:uncharacterized protein (TIGR04141 family)
MPRLPRLERLTVFLIKEGVTRSDALREAPGRGYEVPALVAGQDSLFVRTTSPHPPRWVDFLAPHIVGDQLTEIVNASSGAVLLLDCSNRLFALTFGQGRHLLEASAYEPDFGLRVVLNTVAPDQIKSVDSRTIDELTLHTRRDVSRDANLAAFGLDVTRDLVRAVTGTPQDKTLAHRLTGADALALQTREKLPGLSSLCGRLLTAYQATDYQANFEFIDHLRPERERAPTLNELLVSTIRARDLDDLHLAIPETIDWIDISGFRFSTQPDDVELEPDPRISTYLDSLGGEDISLETLRADRVTPIRTSDDAPLPGYPVYRCTVYEVELEGHLYVLSAGEWYRVSLDFKERVHTFANTLPRPTVTLPPAEPGTDEDAYNIRAANALDALCLDNKFVYEAGTDKMEICDVLTRNGGLIHVKHRGSSSTLSHLFAQGVNCAERLLQDEEFRAKASDVAKAEDPAFEDVLPRERPTPANHEITFAVITRSTRTTPFTLPFFSLVSLQTAARRLQTLGYTVSVTAVLEQTT